MPTDDDRDQPNLVAVPSGTVNMRDARTGHAREIALEAFAIGATAVTRAQFAGIGAAERGFGAAERGFGGIDQAIPQHGVTWFDAIAWCNAASQAAGYEPAYKRDGRRVAWNTRANGFRLPTEAEWEYAARAGTDAPRYGELTEIAWSAADGVDGPQRVAQKHPNAFGLFDTIGNVWEWCWDYADTARYGDYRSFRGGGWADPEWSCRASVRRGNAPDAVLDDVGFRVARGAVGAADADAAGFAGGAAGGVAGFAGAAAAQGWSAAADRARADVRGPRPIGWTPLTELLDTAD